MRRCGRSPRQRYGCSYPVSTCESAPGFLEPRRDCQLPTLNGHPKYLKEEAPPPHRYASGALRSAGLDLAASRRCAMWGVRRLPIAKGGTVCDTRHPSYQFKLCTLRAEGHRRITPGVRAPMLATQRLYSLGWWRYLTPLSVPDITQSVRMADIACVSSVVHL